MSKEMKSRLIYQGVYPVHTLAHDWSSGNYRTLDQLFAVWGEQCQTTNEPDEDFADWFFHTYVKNLGDEWRFVKDLNDFTPKVTEETVLEEIPVSTQLPPVTSEEDSPTVVNTEVTGKTGSIIVESSELKVAASEEEAQKKLKAMRHPDVVGTIQRTPAPPLQYTGDKAEIAKNFPAPGSQVMTGDDLDKSNSLRQSISNGVVLETVKEGTIGAVPITPLEEQRKLDNQLANVNHATKVLQPEEIQPDGSRVQVITGDSFAASMSLSTDNPAMQMEEVEVTQDMPKPEVEELTDPTKVEARVNDGFVAFPQVGNRPEITVNDIVSNPDEAHVKDLIRSCKNTRILKIARNSCYNQGMMKRYEEINDRLRGLPLQSM